MMKIRILILSLLVLFAALPCLAEIVELPDGAMIYYEAKGQGRPILLVEMPPFAFSPEPWNSHGLRNYNYNGMNGFLAAFQENRRASAEGFINLIFKTALAPKADMEWMMREHLKTPTPVAVAIYSDHLMRDYTGVLKTITVPTIVFSGDSNVFKKGIEMGKYVSGQIPGSKFIPFEKSGHLLFYEESDKFNGSLLEFLKEIK